ncbi:MAG: hypothetical protein HQM10_02180 [Candidatus Riflebacteria bacterium]|nr:hypothetical protein [Candidatus Riflebacteria bacterium]
MKTKSLFLMSFLLLFAITGCNEKKIPDSILALLQENNEKTLKVGILGDSSEYNPIVYQERHSELVNDFIHGSPLKRDTAGDYYPFLWESWKQNVGADGNLVVEGIWRQNLKWHDGVAFSHKDFEFTVETMKKSDSMSYLREIAEHIDSITQNEETRTCSIKFKGASRQYIELLCSGLLPEHLLKGQKLEKPMVKVIREGVASETVKQILPAEASDTVDVNLFRFSDYPVGIGSYKVSSRIPGVFMTVEKVADSVLPEIKVSVPLKEKIIFRFYRSIEEQISDLRKKRISVAHIHPDFYQVMKEMNVSGVEIKSTQNPSYLMLGYNVSKSTLSDVNIRKAFDLALDRKKIAEVLAAPGRVLFAAPMFPEKEPVEAGSSEKFDRKKSSELLSSAGFEDKDKDGFLEYKGEKAEFILLVSGDNFQRKAVADEIASQFGKIGLKVTVNAPEWPELIKNEIPSGKYHFFLQNYYAPADGNWINLWHSNPKIGDKLNFTSYTNSELDKTFEKLDGFTDSAERDTLKAKAMEILSNELPCSFLFQPADFVLYGEKL